MLLGCLYEDSNPVPLTIHAAIPATYQHRALVWGPSLLQATVGLSGSNEGLKNRLGSTCFLGRTCPNISFSSLSAGGSYRVQRLAGVTRKVIGCQ